MKKTIDVFIMAGGLNSRFGSPKYLEKIGDEIVLEKLLEMVRSTHINNIFLNPIIIFNHESTIPDNLRATIFRASKSAKGTATMIRQYLKEFGEDNIRDSIVMWSDIVVIDKTVFERLIKTVDGHKGMVIPVVEEKEPYVSVLVDGYDIPYDFHYSKYDFIRLRKGYHDQCMFYFSADLLHRLELISRNHCGERNIMDLLKIAYHLNMPTNLIRLNQRAVESFNTKEELLAIKKSLGV